VSGVEPLEQPLPASPGEHRVAVLGASPKPDRYSNMAIRLLLEKGYAVLPIHPKMEVIEGLPVVSGLAQVEQPLHTLTLYVGPARGEPMIQEILDLKPTRVIFNPGTESQAMADAFQGAGIECVEGCTLVMLRTGQF
jgi:predicted CoA-binding protein